MSQVEVDSANPYKNKLRNAKKKLTDIEALENSGKALDEAQQQKIKTKKKVEKEIADVQASYDNWNNEQIAALNQAKKQAAPKAEGKKAEQKQQPAKQQQAKSEAKPEAKKAEKAAAKKEETPAQQQAQKQQAVKAEKQPQKQAEKSTPPPPAAPVEIDESLNPYRNSVRNAKKKLQAIEALEALKTRDEAQAEKVKGKKKIEKELADAQANYDQWISAQRQALESQSKASKPAEKAKPAKQEQKPQAKQAEQKPAAKQAEQKPQQAQKPAAKKEAPAKAAAPAKQAAPAKPAASEEEVKTARNKVRNLEKKLKQIEELKAKGKGSLSAEQQEKVSAEKKTLKEYNDAQDQLKKLVGDE